MRHDAYEWVTSHLKEIWHIWPEFRHRSILWSNSFVKHNSLARTGNALSTEYLPPWRILCLRIYMIYSHMCMYIYVYIWYIYVCMYIDMRTHLHTTECFPPWPILYLRIYVICIYMRLYIYVYIWYIYECMSIYIRTHLHTTECFPPWWMLTRRIYMHVLMYIYS